MACAGLPWMMTAHLLYHALDSERPGTLSPVVIDAVIRGRIGFQGVLVSDDLAMKALSGAPGVLAVQCLAAGCDVALHCTGVLADNASVLGAVPGVSEVGWRGWRGAGDGRAVGSGWRRVGSGAGASVRVLSALQLLLTAAIPVIVAITLHEAAHGYAAWALGDDTAKLAGRLSLNPLRHVDRFGTLILPGLLILGQVLTIGRVEFMFGWAKPVPVSAWRFRHPRRGMALVAAAGPAMNFLLAWLTALTMHATDEVPGVVGETTETMLSLFILSNLVLGLFNLLPIPPLDGGRIMVGVLPERLAAFWAGLERVGIVVVVLGVFLLPRMLASFGVDWNPVGNALGVVLPWAWTVVNRAAGWDV